MNPFSQRYDDDPWFQIGEVGVTTTILVSGLAAVSMVVAAFATTLWSLLVLDPIEVLHGQVWRLVTWPIANQPSLWILLDIAVFYLFGREIEHRLGRRRYGWFLAAIVLIPAVAATAIGLGVDGLAIVSMAVFAAFVAGDPNAQGFFGIKLWVIGVVFLAINVLQYIELAAWDPLLFLLITIAVALVAARSFGISEISWIPRIPLPGVGGAPKPKRTAKQPRRQRGGRPRGGDVVSMASYRTLDDNLQQAELDVLLDKISATGLDSLTPDERRRLEEHSRRQRGDR
jgi:membrane associated rhomboid family serine protease